jgi:hypothetical protein
MKTRIPKFLRIDYETLEVAKERIDKIFGKGNYIIKKHTMHVDVYEITWIDDNVLKTGDYPKFRVPHFEEVKNEN